MTLQAHEEANKDQIEECFQVDSEKGDLFWRNHTNSLFSLCHRHFQLQNGIIHSNILPSYYHEFFYALNFKNCN